jgi:hypothetical protein
MNAAEVRSREVPSCTESGGQLSCLDNSDPAPVD